MSSYLKEQLQETLKVLDTCLECIYQGKPHMYRALAGQLRIMLCDTQGKRENSLFALAFPNLEVNAIEPILWSKDEIGSVRMSQRADGTNRIAQMPIEITSFANGLVVADLIVSQSTLLPIGKWQEQRLTIHPTRLSVKSIIRTVADKGGGAHVDEKASPELKYMYQRTATNRTFAEVFIIGIGRFVQRLGEYIFKYEGCRVPQDLIAQERQIFNLLVAAHVDATKH
jgi:hypothetical protein